jgi:hypothetical protein
MGFHAVPAPGCTKQYPTRHHHREGYQKYSDGNPFLIRSRDRGDLRQLPVVLKLILQFGELLNDALALLCLLIIRDLNHSPVKVINGTSLSASAIELRHSRKYLR